MNVAQLFDTDCILDRTYHKMFNEIVLKDFLKIGKIVFIHMIMIRHYVHVSYIQFNCVCHVLLTSYAGIQADTEICFTYASELEDML